LTDYINKRLSTTPFRRLLAGCLILAALAGPWMAADAFAEPTIAGETAGEASSAPQAEEDPFIERPPELTYLFAVFMVTWAGFFGYAFVMSRRLRETRRDVDVLRRAIEDKEPVGTNSGSADL
jgi:CcmD family protein